MSALPHEDVAGTVYLYPGQIVVPAEPSIVHTILGSCVAVCLFDAKLRIGGINHFLLPDGPSHRETELRYAGPATERLIEAMLANGCSQSRLDAKVFGGASVLQTFTGARQTLGIRNAEVAKGVLARHGISVSGEAVGGMRGRKIVFSTATGIAHVKEI